jgi:hypothetical protein
MKHRNEKFGTVWTPEDAEELKGLVASGVPASVIALQLGRSVIAVRSKVASLGVRIVKRAGGRYGGPSSSERASR